MGRFGERAAVQLTTLERRGPGRVEASRLRARAGARDTAVARLRVAEIRGARVAVVQARHEGSRHAGGGGADVVQRTRVVVRAGFRVRYTAESRRGIADVVGADVAVVEALRRRVARAGVEVACVVRARVAVVGADDEGPRADRSAACSSRPSGSRTARRWCRRDPADTCRPGIQTYWCRSDRRSRRRCTGCRWYRRCRGWCHRRRRRLRCTG